MRRGQHTILYAVPGTPDMADFQGLASMKRRVLVSAGIFIVLISCIVSVACISSVIFPVLGNNQTHLAENEGNLSVYFLDVGQGDATLFVVDGKTILIDAGDDWIWETAWSVI